MKEIKFRAWSKREKYMYKWSQIHNVGNLDDMITDKDVILRQYTGLKDKNHKRIYEGDVFNFHPSKEWKATVPDNPCVVFWSDGLCAFMFYVGKPEMSTLLPPSGSIEIIGNIYENPELLEVKNG